MMNPRYEIGSLFIVGFPGPELSPGAPIVRDIVAGGLGGVILFDHCLHAPGTPGNIVSPEQLRQLTSRLREYGTDSLFICVDQEGGAVQRLSPKRGFAGSLSPAAMAAEPADTALTRSQAAATAAMLADAGINVNFAPVVDLNTNPGNPVIGALGRSFSADPSIVASHAAAWIEAHRGRGIVSCVKHFPGHGSSRGDSHRGCVDVSASWDAAELTPFRLLLASGHIDMVMTGHLLNRTLDPEYPATLSRATVTGLLRGRLGFEGPVVSDDMQMQAITDHYGFEEAICRAVAAGVDIIIIGNNLAYDPEVFSRAVEAVRRGLETGLITEKRLDAALRRVARLKQYVGGKGDEQTTDDP